MLKYIPRIPSLESLPSHALLLCMSLWSEWTPEFPRMSKEGLAQRLGPNLAEDGPVQPDPISKPQQLRGRVGITTAPTGQIRRNPSNQRHRGAAQHLGGFWRHCRVDLGSELDPGPRDPDLPSSNCPLLRSPQTLIFPAPRGGESPSPGLHRDKWAESSPSTCSRAGRERRPACVA